MLRTTALSILVVLSGAGCVTSATVTESRDERQTFEVGSSPQVIIDSYNGRISVQESSERAVTIRTNARGSGVSQPLARRSLERVLVAIEREGDAIVVSARPVDTSTLGTSGMDVEVSAPSDSSVELRTSNGRVEVANILGSILVRTSNGPITVRGGNGVDLDTTNAPIVVSRSQGALSARTSNGSIDVLAADSSVLALKTSNNAISFSGSLDTGGHLLTTTNGDISISLPADAAFGVDGATWNGSVWTDFPDLVRTDTKIIGQTGIGGHATVITARTTNGDLSVVAIRP